jgi:hypothetical protein
VSGTGEHASAGLLDLAEFIRAQGIQAEIVAPGVEMPTVDAAAAVLGVEPERIFKSILFQARDACAMASPAARGVWTRAGSRRSPGLPTSNSRAPRLRWR